MDWDFGEVGRVSLKIYCCQRSDSDITPIKSWLKNGHHNLCMGKGSHSHNLSKICLYGNHLLICMTQVERSHLDI